MPSSPAVLAGGQLGLLSRSEVAVAGAAAEDLLEALGRVPDPRDPRGHRYPLVPVLEPWGPRQASLVVTVADGVGASFYQHVSPTYADPAGLRPARITS